MHKAILLRIIDSNTRLIASGYNRLLESHKTRNDYLRLKIRFVIGALSNKDKTWVWQAYNGMVEYTKILGGNREGRGEAMRLGVCRTLLERNLGLV